MLRWARLDINITTPDKVALVVGAQDMISRNLVEYLATLDDWRIVGFPCRGGASTERITHTAVDLLDAADTRVKFSELDKVTHPSYAAYQDRPIRAELVPSNLAMLISAVDVIEAVLPRLAHISLMQGHKVYGGHPGLFKTPARRTDVHFMPPEFMFDQQTSLEAHQTGKTWTRSAICPVVVGGFVLGNPTNLAVTLTMYTSISKELGLPLHFSGKPSAYDHPLEMTDVGLLVRATVWAVADPRCANQTSNINSGDLFRWSEMWPRVAWYFNLEIAPLLPSSLDTVMANKAPLWQSMIARHGLVNTPYGDVSSWRFADFVFSWDYDMFGDGPKARRLGFHEYVETETIFMCIFDDLHQRKIIPDQGIRTPRPARFTG